MVKLSVILLGTELIQVSVFKCLILDFYSVLILQTIIYGSCSY